MMQGLRVFSFHCQAEAVARRPGERLSGFRSTALPGTLPDTQTS
jgi:hypothetical protein